MFVAQSFFAFRGFDENSRDELKSWKGSWKSATKCNNEPLQGTHSSSFDPPFIHFITQLLIFPASWIRSLQTFEQRA